MGRTAIVGAAVAALIAGPASLALAGALGVAGANVAAGSTPVIACDTNGFTESYTTAGGLVTEVTIAGIADPSCEGGTLEVTLTDAAGDAIANAGPQTIPADPDTVDNSLTLKLSPQPDSAKVAGIRVVISGP